MPKMRDRITRKRLTHLLTGMRNKRIVVVGDAMLDVYLGGDVERISPEAPVPVVRVRDRRYAMGGAANVAQNVAAAGARVTLVGAAGTDSAGVRLRAMLEAIGADSSSVITTRRPTTSKTRVVARAQQMLRFDEEDDGDLPGRDVQRLLDTLLPLLAKADALVLEDYNKGVLVPAVITAAIEAATQRGIPSVVDPKFRNFFAYRGATIFKPNRRELESALGATLSLDDAGALPATFERLGVEHLLLTLGEKGMALVAKDGEVRRIPTTAREVYDVVGAGDTVTAYLATSLAAGANPYEAALIANYAAGVEVGKLGAATVSPEEIIEAWKHHHEG
ncbi:MAG TPA: D-glycero-beta-D-manno-heptose-7-phosphate kinase [Gemmatimonadaceae bacterium]|jgi:D-beta-D-heptose 7-phosphate kinase/D-beta-D-heptose 1-phosphate adenosyltransferase|nr:D-glycero-beta-D-manno-heptose-7-phosphate kinase [Gemmatimonadaceae bacterium]